MSQARSRTVRWVLVAILAVLVGAAVVAVAATIGGATPATASGGPRNPADISVQPPPPKRLVVDHEFSEVGLMVFDRSRQAVTVTHDPDRQFTSASLVKLLIAFEAVEQGEPAAQVHAMIAESHDPLAGQFWVRYGGPDLVTRWAKRLGLHSTKAPDLPNMWGDTLTTAADVVAVYRYLLEEAPATTRDVVLPALRGATRMAHDGFDQYFGIPDAAGGVPFAVKQGWACCTDGTVLHTSGLVGADDRFIVAVLTRSARDAGYDTAAKHVTGYVEHVLDVLGIDRGSSLPGSGDHDAQRPARTRDNAPSTEESGDDAQPAEKTDEAPPTDIIAPDSPLAERSTVPHPGHG
ncbi:serine hydrolase [Saccharomonospora xinjiangensis]|nr:hypothetical protein EYD13_20330 [Saccharomonospora xinjiangensis]